MILPPRVAASLATKLLGTYTGHSVMGRLAISAKLWDLLPRNLTSALLARANSSILRAMPSLLDMVSAIPPR